MVVKGSLINGHHVLQRPWTPTKRRGPIAAEHPTPGPASFSLPSTIGSNCHDTLSGRAKSPAFSFGGKYEDKRGPAVPGPGSYNISGLCHTGKEIVTSPFLSGRTKVPAPFKTPAPGAYSPEKSGEYIHGGAPKYTFGLKGKDQKPDNMPAPGAYSPEKTDDYIHGGAPKYTFGLKYKAPKPDTIPAPGAYSPEKTDEFVHGGTPKYSFGLKYKDLKPDNIPAPNSYKIPSLVGSSKDSTHKQSPAYSMGIKGEDMWGGMGKHSPGPGKYNSTEADIYKSKSPSYTLSSRTNIPMDRTQKPGPGAHSPEKISSPYAPAYSFGIRHSPYASNIKTK